MIAGLWGLLGGSALLIGAAIAWRIPLSQRVVAGVMAMGAGILISAVAFDLVDEAIGIGGIASTATGVAAGAAIFTLGNVLLTRRGAAHRKRSGSHPQERQQPADAGNGLALALGALLDGIPESIVVGISLIGGGEVSASVVLAIFLSNIPEGLSSAAGMKRAGHSAAFVFGLWGAIALASGIAALAGYTLLSDASPAATAFITAIAAGGILAMLVDTMIPEATETDHAASGLLATAGFLVALLLSKGG